MSKLIYQRRRLNAQKEHTDFLVRCEQLKHDFASGGIVVKPLWWTDLRKIKLPRDKECLKPQGMFLINDISINKLITNLIGRNKDIFKQQELFHTGLDFTKTCKIIEHWKNRQSIIPPRVIWSSYSNSIEVSDGRHRLNAAICLGETKIPILVPNLELAIFNTCLDGTYNK
jgi:hypothetical protein